MSEHDANARFLRESIVEPDSIARARAHAVELGAMPISTVVGSQIAVLAAATSARSIVEIGTGAGVSGLWLLRGAPQAVLTSIDNEPEHLAAARQAFTDAKVPSTKVRFITGRAIDVLPRMNESSYDIVLVDADPDHIIEYVEHGLRLARTGGMVLVPRILGGGRVADPVQRDEVTSAYRSLVQETQESSAVLATVSPAGEGLLQLIRLADSD
ncbi:O-methyltransferase [Microbacterium sp. NPDC055988]|uniref:O-methyltransferase n=1 Tax=Microbacterium sp. NPDC055988 TaxID=3345671 RepID=UPI0035D70115